MKGIIIIVVLAFFANNSFAQEDKPDFRDRLSFEFKVGDGTSTTPHYKNVWYQATLGFRFF